MPPVTESPKDLLPNSRDGENSRRGDNIIELAKNYKLSETQEEQYALLAKMSQVIAVEKLDIHSCVSAEIRAAIEAYLSASMPAPQGPAEGVAAAAPPPTITPPQTKPRIIPFQVNFGGKMNARAQAEQILNKVKELHQAGAAMVGITYSANQRQTEAIIAAYSGQQWKTRTAGINQAQVIQVIEALLEKPEYQTLQGVYRTIPITTMKYEDSSPIPIAADNKSVEKSIKNAEDFMAGGGVLLGWRNQLTRKGRLAIGGGVAQSIQPPAQREMIEQWVSDRLLPSPPLPVAAQAPPALIPKGQSA